MAKVVLEMSMSLDGYIAGPDLSPERPWAATASCCTSGCSRAAPRPNPTASIPTTSAMSVP